MNITAQPDPCPRGDVLKIHLSGGAPGTTVVVGILDAEGQQAEVSILLDERGQGTGDWTVPQSWGASAFLTTPDGASTVVAIS